jgi:lipopolysaccharide export system protein LptA
MPLPIYHLRRWLAGIAILFTVVVAGMYFSARRRQHSFLKDVPGKIGLEIKQTAKGFQFSKSDGGRTLFTIQAGNLKQFKLDGRAELHDVSIVLYGRDSSRFDRISGDDFTYDPKTGDVSANGEVQIDLEANPSGLTAPDQAAPAKLSNPIHLKTRDLVFNKDSGNASTNARVEFQTPQATGWAVGVQYAGKTNSLILASQVHLRMTGPDPAIIEAARGIITNEPRQVVLDQPSLEREGDSLRADDATLMLDADNNVQHVFAHGNVTAQAKEESKAPVVASIAAASAVAATVAAKDQPQFAIAAPPDSVITARANEGDLSLGRQNHLEHAVLTGDVHFDRSGTQPMQGNAGRVTFDFAGQNELRTVHADQEVKLTQMAASEEANANGSVPQNFELIAPAVDFAVAQGRLLQRAVTSGKGQITISAAPASGPGSGQVPQRTVITAKKFDAKFEQTAEGQSRLASIHGAPEARIVSTNAGQPDRVSTSDAVDAAFLAQGGIESITQQGHVSYTDALAPGKQTQASADRAHYTPGDQILTLSGKPRVMQGSMTTTATTIHINRSTGDANADGDVKSTYSQLQEQPQGALLASASPIHVTADSMIAHSKPAVAVYTGSARLWQDANIIEAPSIEFDRECRCVTAQGTPRQPVSTTIVQPEKAKSAKTQPERAGSAKNSGEKSSPIFITGARLTYADAERKVHYEGGVSAKGADFTASAKTMDLFLKPRSDTAKTPNPNASAPAQLDRIVAQNDVIVQQPGRRALGQTLLYEAVPDKFTLTGGPPSIFDAERGKITGVSLTFFRSDDRVLVEGEASTPVVTQTRVAR